MRMHEIIEETSIKVKTGDMRCCLGRRACGENCAQNQADKFWAVCYTSLKKVLAVNVDFCFPPIQTRHHRSNFVSVELPKDWSNYAS
jgi:hypothetical protein